MFFTQIVIGTLLVAVTVVLHALALHYIIGRLEAWGPSLYKRTHKYWRTTMLTIAVTFIFFAHIVQIWLWALFYWGYTDLPDFETALYFSTSCFTTVGFGDVILEKEWRLLSTFQSANGFILFGWSTAFIFEIMSQLYKNETIRKWNH